MKEDNKDFGYSQLISILKAFPGNNNPVLNIEDPMSHIKGLYQNPYHLRRMRSENHPTIRDLIETGRIDVHFFDELMNELQKEIQENHSISNDNKPMEIWHRRIFYGALFTGLFTQEQVAVLSMERQRDLLPTCFDPFSLIRQLFADGKINLKDLLELPKEHIEILESLKKNNSFQSVNEAQFNYLKGILPYLDNIDLTSYRKPSTEEHRFLDIKEVQTQDVNETYMRFNV